MKSSSRRNFLKVLGTAGIGIWPFTRALRASEASAIGTAAALEADVTETAKRVQQEFLHAWNGYKQYAFGHDELRPLSKSYRDWHTVPLYMTPVDSLDTMIIMGLHDEAERTREFIARSIAISQSRTSRSPFACWVAS
jgi:ER degradation enhancer, mannosidase alpha-like 2